jgi:hypothetical protein
MQNRSSYLLGSAILIGAVIYSAWIVSRSLEQRSLEVEGLEDHSSLEDPVELPPCLAGDPWPECGLIRVRLRDKTGDASAEVIRWGSRLLWGRSSNLPAGTVSAGFTVRQNGLDEDWHALVMPNGRVLGLAPAGGHLSGRSPVTTARREIE